MRIVFRCDPRLEPYLPRPQPARAALPDWLRHMPSTAFSETHGDDIRTVKHCPPFVDAMAHGFIVPLPCDIKVADGAISWDWDIPAPAAYMHPRSPISFHVPEQVAGTPLLNGDQVVVKFNSFWTVELPPGWSLFATHPVNRMDLPFRLLSGLVDADRYHDVGILFPALWQDSGFSGVLPRGTPVAQCFPVAREALELCVQTMDEAETRSYDEVGEALTTQRGVYRKRYRAAKRKSAVTEQGPAQGGGTEPESSR